SGRAPPRSGRASASTSSACYRQLFLPPYIGFMKHAAPPKTPTISMAKAYSYVRMSTELQLQGDSRRRQIERSKKFAADHGWEFVEDFRFVSGGEKLRLEDVGSAFTGENLTAGVLGKFLNAIKTKQI